MDDECLLHGLTGEGGQEKGVLVSSVCFCTYICCETNQAYISRVYIYVFIIVLTSEVAS